VKERRRNLPKRLLREIKRDEIRLLPAVKRFSRSNKEAIVSAWLPASGLKNLSGKRASHLSPKRAYVELALNYSRHLRERNFISSSSSQFSNIYTRDRHNRSSVAGPSANSGMGIKSKKIFFRSRGS